jgi:peptidoglycan/xylan/chitin deacetylase (PgdA/CDA1 family)
MRLDRALTLALFGPLGRLRGDGVGIPILMYHSISCELDADRHPYFRTVTTPDTFRHQIEMLRADGYQGITLSQAIDLVADSPSSASARKVVITFDDGFRDFVAAAFPALWDAGFKATVFMPSAFIGRAFIDGRKCLDAAEMRALADQGIEFGSHSATHRRLVELSGAELRAELLDSKAAIEDACGRAVKTFSYPYRFPEQNTRFVAWLGQQLDDCGYQAGVTTAIGRAQPHDDPRFLPRLPVNECDDPALLRAKVSGGYDWLRSGQRLRKRSRALWQNWVRA